MYRYATGVNPFLAKPLAAIFAATECLRYCSRGMSFEAVANNSVTEAELERYYENLCAFLFCRNLC